MSTHVSLGERADIELAETLKYESSKYLNLTSVLGLNIGFFTYQALKTRLYWYVAMPLGFVTYLVSRNLMMRNCMDRIYYPGEMVYKRYRGTDVQKVEKPHKKINKLNEDAENEELTKKEDMAKGQIMKVRNQNLAIEESVKRHFEENKHKEKEQLDNFIHHIHGKWINETDFCDYTHAYIKEQSNGDPELENLIYQEIEKKEESPYQYENFINLYIKLYYEPLVEEYDELKYFTRDFDKKMAKIVTKHGSYDSDQKFKSNISSI